MGVSRTYKGSFRSEHYLQCLLRIKFRFFFLEFLHVEDGLKEFYLKSSTIRPEIRHVKYKTRFCNECKTLQAHFGGKTVLQCRLRRNVFVYLRQ